jgi:teichuronic acid biosynthesis protein TuaF
MEIMIQRMAAKNKKSIFLLLLVPVLFGMIGWFVPAGNEPSAISAEAELSLGSYNNKDLNDPKQVLTLLTHRPFYAEHLEEAGEPAEILSNLIVTQVNERNINLTYTGTSAEKAVDTVNEIAGAFLALDKQKFAEKQSVIQTTIDSLEKEEVAPEAKVDHQRFLYELKTAQLDIKPAVLIKQAQEEETGVESQALSSRDRAVLGVLIGITLMFAWMVIPELVRKPS